MKNLTSAVVTAHGTQLHYYRAGAGSTSVVLVHGITDDGLCWTPVAEVLAEQYDVIMVDMRAHGKSEAPQGGYTLENLARELAGLVTALQLEKPILLGHSMGAISILLLAALFPDLPRAILLEDPPPFWALDAASSQDEAFRQGLTDWINAIKRKTHAELLADARANGNWSEAELEPWVNSKNRCSPRVTELVVPADLRTLDFPTLLGRISCPALFISADQTLGAASGPGDIARLQTILPQLRVTHIPAAGHSIRRDQFARYIEVVQSACLEAGRA